MNTDRHRNERVRLGDLVFDLDSLDLTGPEGQPIRLREKSRQVLRALARRNGETIEKADLIATVWAGRAITDDGLVQCVREIRAALGDSDRRLLRTAIGRGYCLQAVREDPSASAALPRILITAFRTTGETAAAREFADIVTEDLKIALSPRAGFSVTGDDRQQATALFEVSGRVSLGKEALRVFVQLTRGETGAVVFADSWTAPINEAGPLSRDITDKIASVLRVNMFNHAGEAFVARDNAGLNTQELLTKAAYHMSRIQLWNRDEARAALSLAVERDPRHAMALAMRASVGVIAILQEGYARLPDPPEFCLDLAGRAVELAPQVDFVMLTRGCMRLWLDADHDGARADFRRALTHNPVFHLAHQFLAVSEILSGDPAPAIRRVKKIIDLGTVNNPRYPHYLTLLALAELQSGAFRAAFRTAREAHDHAPGDPWCSYVYAAAAADRDETVKSAPFQQMLARLRLPLSHFRSLPVTDPKLADMVETRLRRAGYPETS